MSFGTLGAPIIALADVTKVPLDQLSSSVGRIVAILALLPPWILIFLVTGRQGLRGAWPLAVVGSLSSYSGSSPPRSSSAPTYPTSPARSSRSAACCCCCGTGSPRRRSDSAGCLSTRAGATTPPDSVALPGAREAIHGMIPFGILIAVVVATTGSWSHLSDYDFVEPAVHAVSSLPGRQPMWTGRSRRLFGGFQYSVGAEVGKPVAPQTASIGVSTSKFVRHEGQIIRNNLVWTLVLLAYPLLIALFYRGVLPTAMRS